MLLHVLCTCHNLTASLCLHTYTYSYTHYMQEGEEFLAREAKRAKIDGEEDEDVPVEPDAVTPEA